MKLRMLRTGPQLLVGDLVKVFWREGDWRQLAQPENVRLGTFLGTETVDVKGSDTGERKLCCLILLQDGVKWLRADERWLYEVIGGYDV